ELEEKIKFGQIIEIYFRNKKVKGLVVGLKKSSQEKKPKEIRKIISEDPLIDKNQFKLIKWLSSFYFASPSTILKTSLPKATKSKKNSVAVFHDRDIYRPEINGKSLKISKEFLPKLKKIINIFSHPRRKKFLLLWQDPFEKIALYYFLIKKTLGKGQMVLILVPEIDGAYFLARYFSKITNKILILHSQLKKSEIWNGWQKILNNEINIIIGTRMAIFSPLKNLGLIIVEDEENDLHRSEQLPYYDVRTIAWKISKITKTKLIFSSLAPTVETYYFTFRQGKFSPFNLREEIKRRVDLVDMTEELRKGNFSPLSDQLEEKILETIRKEKKVLLYLKRKGFATFNFCQDCGKVFSCPRCDLPLRAHKKEKVYWLICHHCGYSEELPLKCPNCGGVEIKMKGVAVQKIKEYLSQNEIFKSKIEEEKIIVTTLPFWRDFSERWSKNLELIGIINADVILNQPNFRSFEKTFQELVAILNWSNFFKIPLIIQTWSKDNYAISDAINNDFKDFYQQELEIRREFSYPPIQRFFKLTIQEKNKERLERICQEFEKNIFQIQLKNFKIVPYPIPPRRKRVFE
ncbi:MAG: hypothetical protein ACPLZH_02965, partial [Minisyncoccales bacterium]